VVFSPVQFRVDVAPFLIAVESVLSEVGHDHADELATRVGWNECCHGGHPALTDLLTVFNARPPPTHLFRVIQASLAIFFMELSLLFEGCAVIIGQGVTVK